MTTRFEVRKHNILEQLDAPEGDYHDLSPKGSIDEPIRNLIGEINDLQGLVTTSSCSGRISVFLEGRKAAQESTEIAAENEESRAGPGGKGGGGAWLFISHSAVEISNTTNSSHFMLLFGLQNQPIGDRALPSVSSRYIHLKFEPMILHVLSASLAHAQTMLTAAMGAGFRESGALSLGSTKTGESNPMVAVRSTGYSFDSIIGFQDDQGQNIALVDESYLRILVCIANERFNINQDRIARFRAALLAAHAPQSSTEAGSLKPGWEDADARKQRKREEGLARKQALQDERKQPTSAESITTDTNDIHGMFQ